MELFSQTMQKCLMKMEQNYSELKFLSSRATEETSQIIDEIIQNINIIFEAHFLVEQNKALIIDSRDKICCIVPNVVYCYNWLLLNTHFKVQNSFIEDVQYGYMVGQWPSLSPYLFMQIIWHFKYEMILAESIVHIPLDLCVEILEIVVKCMHEVEYERAIHLIIRLTGNIYRRCLQLHRPQVTENLKECAWQLVAYFQMLLNLLTDSKITRFSKLSAETKAQEHGILIKMLLRHTKKCICMQEITDEDSTITNLFTLAYSTYYNTLAIDDVKLIVQKLQEELISLLLNQVKQVDFDEYLYWAEVDDMDNVMISLQRAIAIDCQDFIQFMKRKVFPRNDDHLEQCLQQFAGNPQSILTLQELCHCITNGKPEGLKELMKRYKEWDESTLNFIKQNLSLLTVDDYRFLLEYLNHVFAYQHSRPKLNQICVIVFSQILVQIEIPILYKLIVQYIATHLHDNSLVVLFKNKGLEKFMARNNSVFQLAELRILLCYLLANAKAVMVILIKIVIGEPQYNHIVFTVENMLLLRPFMRINVSSQHNMLMSCLKDVCMTNLTWNTKKFINFMNIILEKQIVYADQLMNDVYIPYLINAPFNCINLLCVLLCIDDTLKKGLCSHGTNYALLVIGLIKRASSVRKCNKDLSNAIVNGVIDNIQNILKIFLFKMTKLLAVHQQFETINALSELVEPIDRVNIPHLFHLADANVMVIIKNYERRCFNIHARLRTDTRSSVNRHKLACSIKLDRKALIRHMILHAIQHEYLSLMFEMTMVNWFYFGWSSERNAFENVISITMEAMKLVIVYTNIFPCDKFAWLLDSLLVFCEGIAFSLKDLRYVLNILLLNLTTLREVSLNYMSGGKMFELLLSRIQANFTQIVCKDIRTCFKDIIMWVNIYLVDCVPLMNPVDNVVISSNIQDFFIAYSFVCACINVSEVGAHSRIDAILNSMELYGSLSAC